MLVRTKASFWCVYVRVEVRGTSTVDESVEANPLLLEVGRLGFDGALIVIVYLNNFRTGFSELHSLGGKQT